MSGHTEELRVVTYSRVSTAEQVEKGTSLEDQRRRLLSATHSRAACHLAHYQDAGISGVSDSRPGLDELLNHVRCGGVDLVMATKIDRVSRSAVGLLKFVEDLREFECNLVLIDEGLDTSTPAGDLTSGVLGVIGGWERRRIAERTQSGRLTAAREEGRFVGSTPPFGYDVTIATAGKGKRLVVNPDQALAVRMIYRRLVIDGEPAATVSDELNAAGMRPARSRVWTSSSLRRWALREEPLRAASGLWLFSGIEVPIPPILNTSEARQWRDWQTGRRAGLRPSRVRGPYLLSGILHMPCGRGSMGRTTGSQRPTYSCRDHYLPIADPARHADCFNSSCELVDNAVLSHIRNFLGSPKLLEEAAWLHLRGGEPANSHEQNEQQRTRLRDELETESADLRRAGLRGATLAAALLPLQRHLESVERDISKDQRRLRSHTRLQDAKVLDSAVIQARKALVSSSTELWRPLLEVLHTSISIAGYGVCSSCEGSGYLGFEPGRTRGWPANCRDCLGGRNPELEVEIDDIGALAISRRVS